MQNWGQEINLLLFFAFNCSVHTEVWKSDESLCFFSLKKKKKNHHINQLVNYQTPMLNNIYHEVLVFDSFL